jgi:hypothetical protein
MRLDFLPEGSPDCPLVRLSGFDPAEAGQLHEVLAGLASGEIDRVDVHELPFIEPIGGCRLVLSVDWWDRGIIRGDSPEDLACGLTAEAWDDIAGLVEPFAKGAIGFQWLTRQGASWLISAGGDW